MQIKIFLFLSRWRLIFKINKQRKTVQREKKKTNNTTEYKISFHLFCKLFQLEWKYCSLFVISSNVSQMLFSAEGLSVNLMSLNNAKQYCLRLIEGQKQTNKQQRKAPEIFISGQYSKKKDYSNYSLRQWLYCWKLKIKWCILNQHSFCAL